MYHSTRSVFILFVRLSKQQKTECVANKSSWPLAFVTPAHTHTHTPTVAATAAAANDYIRFTAFIYFLSVLFAEEDEQHSNGPTRTHTIMLLAYTNTMI